MNRSRRLTVTVLTAATMLAGIVPAALAADAREGHPAQAGRHTAPIPEHAQERLKRALAVSMDNPDEFGGAWYDPETDDVLIGIVEGASPEVPDDLAATITQVKRSESQLLGLLETVYRLPTPDRGLLAYADVDFAGNRVVAAATTVTEDLARAARETHGDAVLLVTGPEVSVDARGDDTSAFSGGALIGMKASATQIVTSLATCSSGFSWRSSTGTHQMVTAGHCVPQFTGTPSVNTNAVPFFNYELGRSRGSSYLNGTGSVAVGGSRIGDLAVVDVAFLKSSAPRIYVGLSTSNTTIPVSDGDFGSHLAGSVYNVSGSTTGTTANWTVQSESSSYQDSNTGDVISPVVRGERQGQCTRGGDSGGPTYITLSSGTRAIVKGIHSGGGGGGGDSFGGALDPCVEFYSKISGVRNFGGSLARG